MIVFYFTASGNSLAVAKALNGKTLSIPQVLKEKTVVFKDEQIGIVTPCYVGGLPTIVEEFLGRVTLQSNYIFGIITYGKQCFSAPLRLNALALQNGMRLAYVNKIMMVDSSLKYFDMAQQIATQHTKRIDEHLDAIVQEIKAKKMRTTKPNRLYSMLGKIGAISYRREIGDYDKKYTIEASCNNCGICMNVCPTNNITITTRPSFLRRCIRCYACTHNCPQNAIRLAGEKSTARFRNEKIKLSEIVKANNQN